MTAILLFPFTIIYYLINFIWDMFWCLRKPVRVTAKVISIGNIAVGGSGKTSIVALLAQKMLRDGLKVAVVARGYGRPIKEPIAIRGGKKIDWRKTGDEPAMLANMIPDLPIYIDSSKTEAAKRAAADGFKYIVIDDGFQHRKLYRDFDIVCIDSQNPFGNGLLLPSGILREPPRALKRADMIIAFGDGQISEDRFFGKPIFRAARNIASVRDFSGNEVPISSKCVVAFCGLGNPGSFMENLSKTGCKIGDFFEYRDHYIYQQSDISKILAKIKSLGASGAVTTLKDFVKIEELWPSDMPIYRLEIAIQLENEAKFYKLLYDSRI